MKAFTKEYWDTWLQKFFRLPVSRAVWLIVILVVFRWKNIIGDWAFITGLGLIYGSNKYIGMRETYNSHHYNDVGEANNEKDTAVD